MSTKPDYSRTVVLAPRGSKRRVVKLQDVSVPDCWQVYELLVDLGHPEAAERVRTTWHLATHLKMNLAGDTNTRMP